MTSKQNVQKDTSARSQHLIDKKSRVLIGTFRVFGAFVVAIAILTLLLSTILWIGSAVAQRDATRLPVREYQDYQDFNDYVPPELLESPLGLPLGFNQGATAHHGRMRGREFDTLTRRSLVILNNSQNPLHRELFNKYGHVPGTLLIANYFHNVSGEPKAETDYYIVRVPMKGVKDLYFLRQQFMHIARVEVSHVLMHIEFQPESPYEVVGRVPTLDQQNAGEIYLPLSEPFKLRHMVFSFDAVLIKGVHDQYNLVEGLGIPGFKQTEYGLSGRLLSPASKNFDITNRNHKLMVNRLDGLTQTDRERMLLFTFEYSHHVNQSEVYDTVRRNCSTLLIMLLEKARPYELLAERGLATERQVEALMSRDRRSPQGEFLPASAVANLRWKKFLLEDGANEFNYLDWAQPQEEWKNQFELK